MQTHIHRLTRILMPLALLALGWGLLHALLSDSPGLGAAQPGMVIAAAVVVLGFARMLRSADAEPRPDDQPEAA